MTLNIREKEKLCILICLMDPYERAAMLSILTDQVKEDIEREKKLKGKKIIEIPPKNLVMPTPLKGKVKNYPLEGHEGCGCKNSGDAIRNHQWKVKDGELIPVPPTP
ncbi:hypothetical protein IIA15_01035 [candidate division TA06 bacterium]|nr:hypothetical protein [candidate division TA06 bacterium]